MIRRAPQPQREANRKDAERLSAERYATRAETLEAATQLREEGWQVRSAVSPAAAAQRGAACRDGTPSGHG